jgi:hypothetical protein
MSQSTNIKQITDQELKEWLFELAEYASIGTIAAFYELHNNVVLEDVNGDMTTFNVTNRE